MAEEADDWSEELMESFSNKLQKVTLSLFPFIMSKRRITLLGS